MYVTELDRADVAVLIGGNDFRIYTVHRDDKTIGGLVTLASAFWRSVETRVAPVIDDSDACQRHIERLYPKRPDAVTLEADEEVRARIAEWQRLSNIAKTVERQIGTIKNEVRAVFADAGADRIRSDVGTPYLNVKGTLCSPREWAKDSV